MRSVIKIGRDNTNDIIINEPSVSRNHAIITHLADDRFEVKDLGSSNGTFVNDQKIAQHFLMPGDKLRVANSRVDWQAAFQSSAKKTDTVIQEEPFSDIKKTIRLGSSADNDLVINNNFVSAHHAKLSRLKNGNYYLQDMGSSNGSFVNGAKVIQKNFSKTDVVKLANDDLPKNWFEHAGLQIGFYKNHNKGVWFGFFTVLLIAAATLGYINRRNWFGWDCELSAKEMYAKNRNVLVHIEHSYYYTILFNNVKYYVGKNKDFTSQTEANTDKSSLLAYSKISGNGCFIKNDGTILTTAGITNPWLNAEEQQSMLKEVIASKTLKGLTAASRVEICGETGVLKWIQNGVVNNQQNFVEANAPFECVRTDSNGTILQSVKKTLPATAVIADYSFGSKEGRIIHNTQMKYYGYLGTTPNGELIKDTFYALKDSFDISKIRTLPIADSLPGLEEGSAVFNSRGELIGLVEGQHVTLLQHFIKQIKN